MTGTATVQGAAFSVGVSTLAVKIGRVGVGTANPSATLDVVGNANVSSTVTVMGNAFSVGTSTLVIKDGNIGIGTSTPGSALEVNGVVQFGSEATKSTFTSTGNLQLVANSTITTNGTLNISTGTSVANSKTPAIFISGLGRIGLGTAIPVEQLQVTGNIRMPATTASPITGIIYQDGSTYIHGYDSIANLQ